MCNSDLYSHLEGNVLSLRHTMLFLPCRWFPVHRGTLSTACTRTAASRCACVAPLPSQRAKQASASFLLHFPFAPPDALRWDNALQCVLTKHLICLIKFHSQSWRISDAQHLCRCVRIYPSGCALTPMFFPFLDSNPVFKGSRFSWLNPVISMSRNAKSMLL